ncbi:hypothetical protein BKA67DRAFT_540092 [Truncatella angustata]|uniref:J domain-containing protein n=1 Tax=Truncatella angustata TaxID=152316 RepID=A0A9P8RID1_9PEZI|nr:uncharacterized protein BKA67DRAFT_540092 [Truncatella angustata]KAH6646584.1 hypothetical protein BKA67DRAFT_540092 [Truncatella angustata]
MVQGICNNFSKQSRNPMEDGTPNVGITRSPTTPNLTPYDIINQAQSPEYNKRRFQKLVKMYHPDRWQHTIYHGIPNSIRVERYRLGVAANVILLDSVEKKAYDDMGIGWIVRVKLLLIQIQLTIVLMELDGYESRAGCDLVRVVMDGTRTQTEPEVKMETSYGLRMNEIFGAVIMVLIVLRDCVRSARADHLAKKVASAATFRRFSVMNCSKSTEVLGRQSSTTDRRGYRTQISRSL